MKTKKIEIEINDYEGMPKDEIQKLILKVTQDMVYMMNKEVETYEDAYKTAVVFLNVAEIIKYA